MRSHPSSAPSTLTDSSRSPRRHLLRTLAATLALSGCSTHTPKRPDIDLPHGPYEAARDAWKAEALRTHNPPVLVRYSRAGEDIIVFDDESHTYNPNDATASVDTIPVSPRAEAEASVTTLFPTAKTYFRNAHEHGDNPTTTGATNWHMADFFLDKQSEYTLGATVPGSTTGLQHLRVNDADTPAHEAEYREEMLKNPLPTITLIVNGTDISQELQHAPACTWDTKSAMVRGTSMPVVHGAHTQDGLNLTCSNLITPGDASQGTLYVSADLHLSKNDLANNDVESSGIKTSAYRLLIQSICGGNAADRVGIIHAPRRHKLLSRSSSTATLSRQ